MPLYRARKAKQASETNVTETTASTTFVDLATVGPSVTLVTGTEALVTVTTQASNSSAGQFQIMGVAVSGASSIVADDDHSSVCTSETAGSVNSATWTGRITGLTPGSNTFTAKYRVSSGTATYRRRGIVVEAL